MEIALDGRIAAGHKTLIFDVGCGLGGRVHPQIARAKLRALRDGAAIASKDVLELNSGAG